MNVGDVVRLLFPQGTLEWRIKSGRESRLPFGGKDPWSHPPADPIDLFAISAYLLSRSGAYHHVQPETEPPAAGNQRRLIVTARERAFWSKLGADWSDSPEEGVDGETPYTTLACPSEIKDLWDDLHSHFDAPLFQALQHDDKPPHWWRVALALMVVADEAACDVGFLAEEDLQGRKPRLLMISVEARILEAMENGVDGEGKGAFTLSAAAPDLACVLPKSRTPILGCTLRSLSHNLALLPPRGLARGCWLPPSGNYAVADSESPLSLLLFPYPYLVPAKAFRALGTSTSDSAEPWGWFGVEPPESERDDKADEELKGFIARLVEVAERDVASVNGIVFPELALCGVRYKSLTKALAQSTNVELVVAGLHNYEGRSGNFTATTILPRTSDGNRDTFIEDVRQKHHRWRLDQAQITSYALGSVLDANKDWWEKLDILSRSLTVGVLRGATTVTTLICEDLARVDPAQELLRAIGPNIVIALLMDSAQLLTRWPNRYATVLAEDPGSSVLTFTSLGLIERVNATGFYPKSRCIALWRDDLGVRELHLPSDAQALCVTLTPIRVEEATLDGRSDRKNALSWRLTGVQPVKCDLAAPPWRP